MNQRLKMQITIGGWKIKYNGATNIKFYVEENSDVEVSIGSIGSSCNAKISYTDHGGTAHNNTAISAGADVTVKEGKELTLANAHTIHDLIVEEGGKVTLNDALTLENLYLEAQAGASGQVLGATNLTANAVYMDVSI